MAPVSPVTKLWSLFFSAWTVLLTGVFSSWVGSPGLLQWVRLQSYLDSKQKIYKKIQNSLMDVETKNQRLEKNRFVQLREIRRTLGYVASDEIVFDFGDYQFDTQSESASGGLSFSQNPQ